MTTVRAAHKTLTVLANTARWLRELAVARGMRETAEQAQEVSDTLEAAREQLAEDGGDYLDAAEAFISAATDILLDTACAVGRCARARA